MNLVPVYNSQGQLIQYINTDANVSLRQPVASQMVEPPPAPTVAKISTITPFYERSWFIVLVVAIILIVIGVLGLAFDTTASWPGWVLAIGIILIVLAIIIALLTQSQETFIQFSQTETGKQVIPALTRGLAL